MALSTLKALKSYPQTKVALQHLVDAQRTTPETENNGQQEDNANASDANAETAEAEEAQASSEENPPVTNPMNRNNGLNDDGMDVAARDAKGNGNNAGNKEDADSAIARATMITANKNLLTAHGATILQWLKIFPIAGALLNADLTSAFEGSPMKVSAAIKMKKDILGPVLTSTPPSRRTANFTPPPAQQTQSIGLSEATQTLLDCQSALQAEAIEGLIGASKSLSDKLDSTSSGHNRGWNKLGNIYKSMILAANSTCDGQSPAIDINEIGKDIFNARSDSEAHSQMELALKRKGLYYAQLAVAAVKQIIKGLWCWPSPSTPRGVSLLIIPMWTPSSASQAHDPLVLSLKTSHQMDASSLKKLSESDIMQP